MAQKRPPTPSGKLSETARHVVLPSGVVSTGWPSVRDTCKGFGVQFDPWQDGAGRAMLAKRADGTYAASIGGVVISIPRQVGKTFLIGAVAFALCLLNPGLTVIWTAHRLRTASETFASMQAFARRKKVAPYVKRVILGAGDEAVEFHNGSRILFGARERGFGRGFANVGLLVFDEAQILSENAIDDMVPATNTAANPLLVFTGTPPKPTDPSEVFSRKRSQALAGEDEDTVYIEFSADRDARTTDRKQWAKANPSYPKRTPDAAMQRMLKNLSDDSFVREALGIWDEDASEAVIDRATWLLRGDATATHKVPVALAVDITPDRSTTSIGLAGMTEDDFVLVEVMDHRQGTAWVVDRLKELAAAHSACAVLLDGSGPANTLIGPLEESGLPLTVVTARQLAAACGGFFDDVVEDFLKHKNQPELDAAVDASRRRKLGESWAWSRKDATDDISPLMAVTLARFGLLNLAAPDMAEPDVILL